MNRAHKKSAKDSFHFCKDESDDVVKKGKEVVFVLFSLSSFTHVYSIDWRNKEEKTEVTYILLHGVDVSITKCVMFPFSITGTGPAENSHQKVPLVTWGLSVPDEVSLLGVVVDEVLDVIHFCCTGIFCKVFFTWAPGSILAFKTCWCIKFSLYSL